MCSSFTFCIASSLFGIVESDSVILPAVLMLICGVSAAPAALCFLALVSKRLSNDHLASFGGIMFGTNAAIIVSGNMFQAYLFQQYAVWRPVYWFIASMTFFVCFGLIALNFGKVCKTFVGGVEYTKCDSIANREE